MSSIFLPRILEFSLPVLLCLQSLFLSVIIDGFASSQKLAPASHFTRCRTKPRLPPSTCTTTFPWCRNFLVLFKKIKFRNEHGNFAKNYAVFYELELDLYFSYFLELVVEHKTANLRNFYSPCVPNISTDLLHLRVTKLPNA